MNGESLDIKQTRQQKLKELFPEVFTENQVDWEKLKASFSDDINFANERYVLNWAGKSDAFRVLQQPTTATLKPIPEESVLTTPLIPLLDKEGSAERGVVDFISSTTQNLFIEGENLEVLKVLQKAYYGKVKCIIIDPPYNTGSDSFIYPDRFSEKKEDYLKRIGDKDEEGFPMKDGLFRKNSKDSGHFHSNWLSMMYPRLFFAKNLLCDDGVIFVHIDDNEVHNLRLVMNEIFGEENFVAEIVWHSKYTTANDAKYVSGQHEYILLFAKNISNFKIGLLDRTDAMNKAYQNPDNDYRGHWKATPLHAKSGNKTYEITFPNGVIWSPPQGRYPLYNENKLLELYNDNRIFFGKDGKATPNEKSFLTEVKQGKTVGSVWNFKDVGSSHQANEQLAQLLTKGMFDNPKSIQVIQTSIKVGNVSKDDIVLDFFGGSGTTAQAVLELNKEDGGNRKFILVQMPEKCDENSEAYKAGYKTIADIAKERIRRVVGKIEKENTPHPNPLPQGERGLFPPPLTGGGEGKGGSKHDLGFKVFKLSPSSFKIWRGSEIDSEEKLTQQLDAFTNPTRPGAEKQNMLYELILKAGYELTSPVQYITQNHPSPQSSPAEGRGDLKVQSSPTERRGGLRVPSPLAGEGQGEGYYSINNNELIIALDAMNEKLVKQIITAKPQKVITLDSLFTGNDQLKTNTVLQMRDAGIDFKTI
jgi:adenine-specific DNA-methyltransferase